MEITLNRADIKTFLSVARKVTGLAGKQFDSCPVAIRQDHQGITLETLAKRANVANTTGEPGPVVSHTLAAGALKQAAGKKSETATLSLAYDADGDRPASVLCWTDSGIPKTVRRFYRFPEYTPRPAEMTTIRNLIPLLREAEECADVESTRYALGGCYLGPEGKIAATDSRHLIALNSDPFPWPAPLVLPTMNCWGMAPFKRATDAAVALSGGTVTRDTIQSGTVTLSVGTWRFTASPIEGRFPRYADVIPDSVNCVSAAVLSDSDRRFLADAIKVLPGLSYENRGIDLELNGHVKAIAGEEGTDRRTEIILSGSHRDGEELCICADYSMMRRALLFGSRLDFAGPGGAIVARAERGDYILMPLSRDEYRRGEEPIRSTLPARYPNVTTVYSP